MWKVKKKIKLIILLQAITFYLKTECTTYILQNEYSIKTNRPIVKFSYSFLKIHKLVSRFHKFERWKKIFHIHKKCPWYTKMRFFKDSLSSTYYYYFTTVEETRWERQGQFYRTKNENRFKKVFFFIELQNYWFSRISLLIIQFNFAANLFFIIRYFPLHPLADVSIVQLYINFFSFQQNKIHRK